MFLKGQGIQNIQQQMLGQAMGSIGGQPMVQYQQQPQQVYQQSLGLQQVNIKKVHNSKVKLCLIIFYSNVTLHLI